VILTPGVVPQERCSALFKLVREYPEEQALPILRAALKDDTIIQTVRFKQADGTDEIHQCRLHDVARAFILYLGRQEGASYGYEYPAIYGKDRLTDPHFIRDGNYALRTEEKRTYATMKFGWWELKRGVK